MDRGSAISAGGPTAILRNHLSGEVPRSRRCKIKGKTKDLACVSPTLHGDAAMHFGVEALFLFLCALFASAIAQPGSTVPPGRDDIGPNVFRSVFDCDLASETNHTGF